MKDEQSIIRESVAMLPHASLKSLVMEPKARFRPDARGILAFENGVRVEACFEVGEYRTLTAIEEKSRRIEAAAAELGLVPILVAPFFSETQQQFLRDRGMGFLDAAGNAWVVAQGVFVDRSGKRPSSKIARPPRSLFSDKATLVIRLLFPGESLGVRQMSSLLAEEGFSLTPGYISKTATALMQDRYAAKEGSGKVRLASRSLLLEDWVAAYGFKARRQPAEGWYLPEADLAALAKSVGRGLEGRGALTGRSGAHFVDPYASFDAVDILPRDYSAVTEALRSLGAEPVGRGANINLHAPVYPVSSFFGMRDARGVPVVSDLQLYLDLRCEPKRGQEAAEHLYNRTLRPLLEEAS